MPNDKKERKAFQFRKGAKRVDSVTPKRVNEDGQVEEADTRKHILRSLMSAKEAFSSASNRLFPCTKPSPCRAPCSTMSKDEGTQPKDDSEASTDEILPKPCAKEGRGKREKRRKTTKRKDEMGGDEEDVVSEDSSKDEDGVKSSERKRLGRKRGCNRARKGAIRKKEEKDDAEEVASSDGSKDEDEISHSSEKRRLRDKRRRKRARKTGRHKGDDTEEVSSEDSSKESSEVSSEESFTKSYDRLNERKRKKNTRRRLKEEVDDKEKAGDKTHTKSLGERKRTHSDDQSSNESSDTDLNENRTKTPKKVTINTETPEELIHQKGELEEKEETGSEHSDRSEVSTKAPKKVRIKIEDAVEEHDGDMGEQNAKLHEGEDEKSSNEDIAGSAKEITNGTKTTQPESKINESELKREENETEDEIQPETQEETKDNDNEGAEGEMLDKTIEIILANGTRLFVNKCCLKAANEPHKGDPTGKKRVIFKEVTLPLPTLTNKPEDQKEEFPHELASQQSLEKGDEDSSNVNEETQSPQSEVSMKNNHHSTSLIVAPTKSKKSEENYTEESVHVLEPVGQRTVSALSLYGGSQQSMDDLSREPSSAVIDRSHGKSNGGKLDDEIVKNKDPRVIEQHPSEQRESEHMGEYAPEHPPERTEQHTPDPTEQHSPEQHTSEYTERYQPEHMEQHPPEHTEQDLTELTEQHPPEHMEEHAPEHVEHTKEHPPEHTEQYPYGSPSEIEPHKLPVNENPLGSTIVVSDHETIGKTTNDDLVRNQSSVVLESAEKSQPNRLEQSQSEILNEEDSIQKRNSPEVMVHDEQNEPHQGTDQDKLNKEKASIPEKSTMSPEIEATEMQNKASDEKPSIPNHQDSYKAKNVPKNAASKEAQANLVKNVSTVGCTATSYDINKEKSQERTPLKMCPQSKDVPSLNNHVKFVVITDENFGKRVVLKHRVCTCSSKNPTNANSRCTNDPKCCGVLFCQCEHEQGSQTTEGDKI